ncbi:hypothetical protein PF008_g2990 [Phytophthora fragariae]|uniref:Uncharacterized protein n=1 Tax=Phytophthora fragariae TaxID=53985 RepID=A0A6G0SH93_9STRA|nr:hypothetical protein PF008_g2990 [Phytophthora fragariae]
MGVCQVRPRCCIRCAALLLVLPSKIFRRILRIGLRLGLMRLPRLQLQATAYETKRVNAFIVQDA